MELPEQHAVHLRVADRQHCRRHRQVLRADQEADRRQALGPGPRRERQARRHGYKSKIKAKIRGDRASIKIKAQRIKGKKVKGKLTVKEIVRVKDDGTIKYKKIGKTKIKKGKGTVSLKKLKKGKHKIVFFFQGKGKVGSSELTKTVKTKR